MLTFTLLHAVCSPLQRELHEVEVRQLLELQQAQRSAATTANITTGTDTLLIIGRKDAKPPDAKPSKQQRQTAWPK
jgi:hypothetical protein